MLRPTTRSPVLVHNPADGDWFGADRLLPDLERVHHPTHDPQALQLVALDVVPQGLAILDAPDIDSVEESNRHLAAQLLAAADLWLFVTSAARYADQVPWDFLRQAAERSAAVAIVLDRTPPDAVTTVASHLARMLAARGLKDSPLFTVNEVPLDDDGLLPPREVAEIRRWLTELGADADARAAMVQQTIEGAIRSLTRRAHTVADACLEQAAAAERLRDSADAAYDEEIRKLLEASADGTLLRGEVLVRWQEFVGTGELLKSLEAKVGWFRDRMVNAIKGKPAAGRAGQRRGRVEPRDPDRRARRGRRRAGRGVVGEPGARPRAALRRRRGPRPREPRAAAQGRARRPRLAAGGAGDGPHRGRGQAQHRPLPGLRRQRAVGGADGRRLLPDRRAHRRRGRASRAAARCWARSSSRRSSATRPCAPCPSGRDASSRCGSGRCSRRSGRATPISSSASASTRPRPTGCATRSRAVDDLRYAGTGRAGTHSH